jgi:hypothetical protein
MSHQAARRPGQDDSGNEALLYSFPSTGGATPPARCARRTRKRRRGGPLAVLLARARVLARGSALHRGAPPPADAGR